MAMRLFILLTIFSSNAAAHPGHSGAEGSFHVHTSASGNLSELIFSDPLYLTGLGLLCLIGSIALFKKLS